MELPLIITFKDFPHSDAVATAVRHRVDKLARFSNRIISCRVTIHEPHRHHHQGRLYNVTIDLTLPGMELAVGQQDRTNFHAHEDIYVAIRDSFLAMERQLKAAMAKLRGEEKPHASYL
ncbi:HPF/RaiA family ribosome-associated protein [Bdellovibrionota bacterium FG-1]